MGVVPRRLGGCAAWIRACGAWIVGMGLLLQGVSRAAETMWATFVDGGAATGSINLPDMQIGGPMTIEARIGYNRAVGYQEVITLGTWGSDSITMVITPESNLYFTIWENIPGSGATQLGQCFIGLNGGAWNNITGVVEADKTIKLYKNGTLAASSTLSALPSTTVVRTGGAIGRNFANDLMNVRVWNVARTEAQIQADQNLASVTGPVSGLYAAYSFGTTGSGVIEDSSGNGRHGTSMTGYAFFSLWSDSGVGTLKIGTVPAGGRIRVLSGRLLLRNDNPSAGNFLTWPGASLQVGDGGTAGSLGSADMRNDGALEFNRSDNLTVSSVISSGGSLTKSGTGKVTLTGANTLSGTVTINAGTLEIGAGGTSGSSGTGAIVNHGTLAYNRSDDITVPVVISGTGSLTKSGAGTVTLSAMSSYTGGTVVNQGVLALAAGGEQGAVRGTVTVESAGTLRLTAVNALGWGDGTKVNSLIVKGGLVETTASGDNGWGVAYQMTGGELRSNGGASSASTPSWFSFGGGSSVTTLASSSPAVISGRILLREANVNDTMSFDVADGPANIDLLVTASLTRLGTAGNIRKNGPGTMVLSGNNTHFGPTTIAAGTLQVGSGGTAGDLGTGAVVNNAALVFDRSDTWTVGNAISGTGTLTKSGAGTAILTGANSYTGATTVSAGTLQVGGGGTSGSLGTGAVVNHAGLAFNRSDALTVGNAISGTGSVTQSGTGTLTLTGASTYSGTTIIGAGTLALGGSGSLAGTPAIQVASGAKLDVSGRSTLFSLGASQVLANSGANGLVNGDLDASAGILSLMSDGVSSAFTVSGGTLTVGAGTALKLNKTGSALGVGTYKVIARGAGGTVAGVAPGVQVEGSGLASGTQVSAEITGGELYVKVAALQTVTGANNLIAANLNGQGSFALPTLPATTIPLTMEIWVKARTLQGTARLIELAGTSGDNIVLLPMNGKPALYLGTGSEWLAMEAPNTMPLNTWTHVAAVIDSSRKRYLYVNGQLVATGAATAYPADVARSSNYIGKSFYDTDPLLDASVADVRIWSVARTQAEIQAAMSVGSITGAAAGLVAAYPFGSTGAGVLADVSGNARTLTQAGSPQFEKSGTGSVATSGFLDTSSLMVSSGTLILDTSNAFSGGATVTGGTLQVGSGGTTGDLGTGAVVNNAALVFDRSDTWTVGNAISGTGTLTKSGAGTAILTGANSYTGATTVSAGTLQVGGGGTSGSLGTGAVVNHAGLAFNRSDALTVGNAISGTGSVTQSGTGTVTLTGASTYSGTTIIAAGTLALGGSGSLVGTPTIQVASGATFDVSGRTSALALASGQTLSSPGTHALLRGNISTGSGTLAMGYAGTGVPFTLSAGTLTVSSSTVLRLTKTGGVLAAGRYKVVAKGNGGIVTGTPSTSVTIDGDGYVAGATLSAEVLDGELYVRVTLPATVALTNLAQTYNGTGRLVTATTTPAGLAVSIAYNGSAVTPTNAGTYGVVATISDAGYMGSASGTLVVSKAPATLTLANLSQTYTGKACPIVATTEPPGLSWNAIYNGLALTPTNVGIYTVIAAITDPNYVGTAFGRLTIKKADPNSRPPANDQPPLFMNHQGTLVDASGNLLGSPNPQNYNLIFRIYPSETGGSTLWSEQQSVTVYQGNYSVQLGDGMSVRVEPRPSLAEILSKGTPGGRFLEVTVLGLAPGGTDVVMSPRFTLISQPYSFLSLYSTTAGTLRNATGATVMRTVGSTVGINVENPNAALDVGGTVEAETLTSDTDLNVSGSFSADEFEGGGTLPVGGIILWTGATPPPGWALCDGQMVNGRQTPDLRSRFVLGAGNGTGLAARSVGQVGGSVWRTIGAHQMPSHNHLVSPTASVTQDDGGHEHSLASSSLPGGRAVKSKSYRDGGRTDIRQTAAPLSHSSHNHTLSIPYFALSHVGNGHGYAAIPPFYALAYIMRVQ